MKRLRFHVVEDPKKMLDQFRIDISIDESALLEAFERYIAQAKDRFDPSKPTNVTLVPLDGSFGQEP